MRCCGIGMIDKDWTFVLGAQDPEMREIERVVGAVPGVRAVRVTALPDALRENDIALDVEGDVTEADVKAWCEERLAAYKRPTAISVHPARR